MNYMLNNIINYYEKVTDLALINLKNEKSFQFKAKLNNDVFMKIQEDHLINVYRQAGGDILSNDARKIILKYQSDIKEMHKLAVKDYQDCLKLLKNTDNMEDKQKILNKFAEKGIHGFTSKIGDHWNIETYSNMYFTNVNNELVRLGVIDGAEKTSKFQVSSHNTKCNLCKPWEGRILTREEALRMIGEHKQQLFHVRCKHILIEVLNG